MNESGMGGTNWVTKNSLIKWNRAGSVWPDHTLFGSRGVDQNDVKQGQIGNCWFMAAANTLAKVPSRVENLFLNTENRTSPNGIYGINMYLLGVPRTIIIDDFLPL